MHVIKFAANCSVSHHYCMKKQINGKLRRRVTINLTENEEEELSAYANKHEQKIAWVVRKAIKRFLDDESQGQQRLDLD